MQTNRFTKISFLLGLTLILSLTGLRCRKGLSPQEAAAIKPVTLQWWRAADDEASARPLIESYKALHPNVNIQYRKIRLEDYEEEILNALAEDKGPDIISIHNTWMGKYRSKLAPLPYALTIPFQEVTGGLKKEVVVNLKTTPTLSTRALKDTFVDAVVGDVLVSAQDNQGQTASAIFGLPLALDVMVLYSNRDMLNLAGIPEAPKTWSEFQEVVKKLTKIDAQGNLIQSGAAIGASRNVERAADILALLMMQNGAQMIDAAGAAAFHKIPPTLARGVSAPGEEALTFYSDFANPEKEVYTWSLAEPNSLTAFTSGKTAMFLGYAYHLPLLKARAPRMNLSITPVPQIEGNPEVNFANYWIETVSRKSVNQSWAWDFIQFAASPKNVGVYLEAVKKPTALRSLIAGQVEKEEVGIFASQVLTAKSWYKGMDAKAAETALLDAIDRALTGAEPREVLNVTAQRVNQTLR